MTEQAFNEIVNERVRAIMAKVEREIAAQPKSDEELEGDREIAVRHMRDAAPDMYEALKEMREGMVCICRLKHFTGQECKTCAIDLVLAKAEGRA